MILTKALNRQTHGIVVVVKNVVYIYNAHAINNGFKNLSFITAEQDLTGLLDVPFDITLM